MVKSENCVIWIKIFLWLHCMHEDMIFTGILQKMLKLDLILQIMNYIDHCLNKRTKK